LLFLWILRDEGWWTDQIYVPDPQSIVQVLKKDISCLINGLQFF
jgi:hypothetical protein